MSNPHVLSALQEKRVHLEKELAEYRSRVSLATAELDALEATICLFSPKPEKAALAQRLRLSRVVAPLALYGGRALSAARGMLEGKNFSASDPRKSLKELWTAPLQ